MQRLSSHTFRQRDPHPRPSNLKRLWVRLPWGRIIAAALMVFAGYGLGSGALSLAHEAAERWAGPPISPEAAAFLNDKKPTKPQVAAPIDDKAGPVKMVQPAAALVAKPRLKTADFHRSFHGQDPVLTQKMRWLLDDYEVPEGGIVVLDIHTGDILTAVGRRNGKADVKAITTAQWPAASVFKVVTGSALLRKGMNPKTKSCFNGGLRKVRRKQLDQTKGARCSDFVTAFGKSQNIPFARWTDKYLTTTSLKDETVQWGFGLNNRFQLPIEGVGAPVIPKERLAFARTGAGFGQVPMSPLHGALLASAIANEGTVALPKVIANQVPVTLPVMTAQQTKVMKQAMIKTVKKGSARRAFLERRRPAMGRLGAGGKTGSLFIKSKAGQDLTWFVGFAPAQEPEIAVAAYVINGPKWRIRAPYMGREALRAALLKTSPYRPTQDPLLVQHKLGKAKGKKSAARK